VFAWLKSRRRKKLAARPFPDEWLPYLEHRVGFWRACPPSLSQRFLDDLKVFVWEKHWIEAGGMTITDEVKVVVAAAAARLVMHLDLSYYDRLTEIVVYPGAYQHPDGDSVILGEAHNFGTVVLSWQAVLDGLADPHDGHDTATHELAHVLDRGGGAFDGTPSLRARDHYRPWADVMSHHFFALRDGASDQLAVLREYGATNEAEFFAVATEAFFERPMSMKQRTPDLYEVLRQFYGFDPCGVGP